VLAPIAKELPLVAKLPGLRSKGRYNILEPFRVTQRFETSSEYEGRLWLPSCENTTLVIQRRWPWSVCSACPDLMFHISTVRSRDAYASFLPSGENTILVTGRVWPLSVFSTFPVLASHTCAVPSFDAEASVLPSGENAMLVSEW
jgi:hypothetical protein